MSGIPDLECLNESVRNGRFREGLLQWVGEAIFAHYESCGFEPSAEKEKLPEL